MKFVVKQGLVLPEMGAHRARVTSVTETTAKTKQKTPQLEVSFKCEDGKSIRKWYNLVGWEHDAEGDVVFKNDKPVPSKEKTADCMNILGVDAFRMGAGGADDSIDTNALVGCECGIQVEPNINGKPSVEKIYSVEYLESILA